MNTFTAASMRGYQDTKLVHKPICAREITGASCLEGYGG